MQKQKKKGCLVIFVKHKFTFFLSQQLWTGGLRSIKPGPRRSTDRLRSLECCAEMRHRGCVVHRRPPAVWECEALLHVHSSRDCCLLLTFIPSRQLLKLLRSWTRGFFFPSWTSVSYSSPNFPRNATLCNECDVVRWYIWTSLYIYIKEARMC